ncbi:MAG: M56 family metallopeptidase [Actinomycetota bacterium]|nr:M56 family metallopeptidase [Actinomycetota bacterium]
MTSSAPAILALETDSAWVVILAVSVVTLVIVGLLRRLIGRPGGLFSGLLLLLPLVTPLLAAFVYEQAVLPEIAVLQPAATTLLDRSENLMHLLLVDDGSDRGFTLYALSGSAGPWLVLIGASATSFMLLRRLAGRIIVARTIKRSVRPDPRLHGEVEEWTEELAAESGLKHIPELLVMTSGVGAFATGGGKSKIVISEDLLCDLEPSEVRAILAHEIAHLQAKDVQLMSVAGVLRDLVAWNPFAHVAYRRLAVNRELEADRRAAEATKDPLAVASGLVKICELMRSRSSSRYPAPAFLRSRGRLKRRVSALIALADGGAVAARPAASAPYLIAALLALVLGLEVAHGITRDAGSGLAIMFGSSAEPEPWYGDTFTRRAKWQHGEIPESPSKADSQFIKRARRLEVTAPYSAVFFSMRRRDLPRWKKQIADVARRRGISPDEVLSRTSDMQAVPLMSDSGLGIYRLNQLR